MLGCLLLLPVPGAGAVPQVPVTRHGAPPAQGVSETFLGTSKGQRAIFKPNAPVTLGRHQSPFMKTGNIEAEWLSARIMQRSGLGAPDVDIVRIPGEAVPYARIQHLEERFPGRRLAKGIHHLPRGAEVDMDALRRMQVTDLLIGNADRHGNNVWFLQDARTGRWTPVPFDHNLAMGTKTSMGRPNTNLTAFKGSMIRTAASGAVVPSGGSQQILGRNRLYEGTMHQPRAAQGLLNEARAIQAGLTDQQIRQLVAEMPDEAIGTTKKAARRKELVEHLIRRRDNLYRTTEAVLKRHPDYLRTAWRLDGLPPHLRSQLPTDVEGRWRFVHAMRGDGRFDAKQLRAVLATSGLPPDAAREITSSLKAQGGVRRRLLPTGADIAALGAAPKVAKARKLERVRDPHVDFQGRPKRPTWDFLEVAHTGTGAELRGVDGRKAPPRDSHVRMVAKQVQGEVELRPGEKIRVTRKPGGLRGVDVHVVGAEGQLLGKTRYHTPLGKPIRTARKLTIERPGGGSSSVPAGSTRSLATRSTRSARPVSAKPKVKVRFRPKLRVRGFR